MSRIEQIITEIEDYIDSCKYQPLSNAKILVNKEEIEELLVELRLRIPEEIKKYQEDYKQSGCHSSGSPFPGRCHGGRGNGADERAGE